MNLIEAVKKLNGSFSFGNQVLYDMCSNVNTDISKPAHLADMIWLIGRAYAASPERRTYGYEKDANGKVKKDANDKWVPLWKATNADDGKGGYFISIAKHITRSSTFAEFKEIFDNLKNSSYVYDGGDNDIQMLCNGVCAVNLYNYLIREASEEFDGLNDKDNPNAVKAKEAKAHCKNQISFCSKFLHFCSPNIVFIIDQYSYDGGKKLIPQKKLSYNPTFEKSANAFEELECIDLKNEYKAVFSKVKDILDNQKKASCSSDTISTEDEKISSYVEHCVRAYCVAKYLNDMKDQGNISITPRLIDDLFLRVKKQAPN